MVGKVCSEGDYTLVWGRLVSCWLGPEGAEVEATNTTLWCCVRVRAVPCVRARAHVCAVMSPGR
jgi:hypothetical protein